MLAIYKKEMQGYFTSMVAYLFLACFVALVGVYFVYYCVANAVTDFTGYVLPSTCMWFAVLIPIITMRLWAEEKKQKTDQLLLTSPVSVTRIVMGKFFAVVTLFFIAVCLLLLFPFMLHFYGDVTWSTIFTGFLGYFLLGCSLLAVGFFISTITENQIIAAVISAVVILLSYFLENLTDNFPGRARYSIALCVLVVIGIMCVFYRSTRKVIPPVVAGVVGIGAIAVTYFVKSGIFDNGLSKFVNWVSVLDRFYNFTDGLLDVSAIIYYLSFIGVFLYLTIRSIEKKRWN